MGDSINDGLELDLADVGMAIGGLGSDGGIEMADLVIMSTGSAGRKK